METKSAHAGSMRQVRPTQQEVHICEDQRIQKSILVRNLPQHDALPDVVFECDSDIPPSIPDGDHYEVVFAKAEKRRMWGQEKLFLWFQMFTQGECVGQRFYMACNVVAKGRWTPSCKFWQAWVLASGHRPNRRDRMSTDVFKNKVFRVRIRKVVKTAKQLDRTPEQQYSVIDDLVAVVAGH